MVGDIILDAAQEVRGPHEHAHGGGGNLSAFFSGCSRKATTKY